VSVLDESNVHQGSCRYVFRLHFLDGSATCSGSSSSFGKGIVLTYLIIHHSPFIAFLRRAKGTANAIVGGWGNLGGGVTQLVMGSVLFPLFKLGMSAEMAWRTVCVVPAVVAFATGVTVLFISDDAPKGNYRELKRKGSMPQISAAASFRSGSLNINTWLLFVQYACCFGVELTMNNAAALYFYDQFDRTTEQAAAIASIFGWMNLFARGLGGFASDWTNKRWGMRGRFWTQTIFLAGEGAMVLIFANTLTLAGAIVVMVFFSLFVQAAEGSTYGIVPYVDPPSTGSISGIVGAGGNTGAGACIPDLLFCFPRIGIVSDLFFLFSNDRLSLYRTQFASGWDSVSSATSRLSLSWVQRLWGHPFSLP